MNNQNLKHINIPKTEKNTKIVKNIYSEEYLNFQKEGFKVKQMIKKYR